MGYGQVFRAGTDPLVATMVHALSLSGCGNSECRLAFNPHDFSNLMACGDGVHVAEERLRSCHIKPKCQQN